MQGEPRAVVAISEDRKWLVVQQPGGDCDWFAIYDFGRWGYEEYHAIEDTGQDAHEVLRGFLEGRSDQDHHV